ncbi:MAG: hypothetical protein KAS07_03550 [Candidatus Pacebacteria bacterium]|nr:hypothetical protein [Candidatus Paceibacterota bacterium]
MNSKEIQIQLKNMRVKSLNTLEQERVWKNVHLNISPSAITKSSRRSRFSTFKKSIAITLIFGLTAGVTFAADSAKPGDTLFTLDRALEDLRLSISSEDKKDELKVKFALERVSEVKDILKEVAVSQTKTIIKTAPEEPVPSVAEETFAIETQSTEESPETFPAEETTEIMLIEDQQQAADETTVNNTGDMSLQEGVDDIIEDDPTQQETGPETTDAPRIQADEGTPTEKEGSNETVLEQDQEQPEKISVDNTSLSQGDKERIELALGTALSFLGDVKGELAEQGNDGAVEYIDLMLEQINAEIDTLPSNVIFEVNLSTKKERVKFEIVSKDDKPTVQIEINEPEENIPEDQETPAEKTAGSEETTLEIKDGDLVITPAKDSADTDSEGNGPKGSDKPQELTDDEITIKDEGQTEDPLPEEKDTADTVPTQTETDEKDGNDDGTTTVKVIIKKLKEEFEISVIDNDEGLHDIIDEYTDEKEDV